MATKTLTAAVFSLLAFLVASGSVQGAERQALVTTTAGADVSEHRKFRSYRHHRKGGPRVRGYLARRGGYSYEPADVVNTYGQSRSLYGSVNSFRDPMVDRQTTAGPFDHGFFFDSGVAPRGGDSPYLH
jgi:hypothetical protein